MYYSRLNFNRERSSTIDRNEVNRNMEGRISENSKPQEFLPSFFLSTDSSVEESTKKNTQYVGTPDTTRRLLDLEPSGYYTGEASPWTNGGASMDQRYIRRRNGGKSSTKENEVVDGFNAASSRHQSKEFAFPPPPTLSLLDESVASSTPQYREDTTLQNDKDDSVVLNDSIALSDFHEDRKLAYHSQLNATENFWIRVFGFLPNALSTVLKKLQTYGEVLKFIEGNGNWIYIQYRTKLQAEKVLSMNGKMIADSVMIGAIQCTDKEISEAQAKNCSVSNLPPARTKSQLDRQKREYEVNDTLDIMNPPKKRSSVCRKVMEYIFNY